MKEKVYLLLEHGIRSKRKHDMLTVSLFYHENKEKDGQGMGRTKRTGHEI